jgi:hypothetical protein
MQQTLWGEKLPQRRRRKKQRPPAPKPPYSITEGNDCDIIGHTITIWDLAGCTTCLDCGVSMFCPRCISAHPKDANAKQILFNRHEERTVSA